MPSKRNARRNRKRRSGPRANPALNAVVTVSGTEPFCTMGATIPDGSLVQTAGAIVSGTTFGNIGSLTGILGKYTPIAPGMIGPRARNIGDCFAQYRIKTLTFKYRPTQRYVNDSVFTATTLTSGSALKQGYNLPNTMTGDSEVAPDLTVAIGWQADPAFSDEFTPLEVVQADGKWVDLTRPWSFTPKILPSPWLFNPVPDNGFGVASDPGTLRTNFCGQFNAVYRWGATGTKPPFNVSGGTPPSDDMRISIGAVDVSWTIEFRKPIDPDIDVGSSASPAVRESAVNHFLGLARPGRTPRPVVVSEVKDDGESHRAPSGADPSGSSWSLFRPKLKS